MDAQHFSLPLIQVGVWDRLESNLALFGNLDHFVFEACDSCSITWL